MKIRKGRKKRVNPVDVDDAWHLTLFVADSGSATERVRRNLSAICDDSLRNRYIIDVIDIREHPDLADQFSIIAVPTLVRRFPEPERRVIGDLSLSEKVIEGLAMPRFVDRGDRKRRLES